MAKKSRQRCANGCGRGTYRADGVCSECEAGRSHVRPDVRRLSDAYLAECVAEALRRDDEQRAAEEAGKARLGAAVITLRERLPA